MRRLLLSLSLCALMCAPVYAQRSDTDDGSVPGGKTSVTVTIGESYLWNGVAWVRLIGDATNGLKVQCASGCAGGTTDTDDGTIAGAQTPNLNIAETYVWDGANWKRLTIGTAGSPSTQVGSVQGVSGGLRLPVTHQDSGGTSTTDTTAHADKALLVDSTGAAIATSDGGAGVVTSNTSRMTLASDDPAVTSLQLLDNAVSGSGYNISQINGVTPLMGNGVTGTGSPRVTIASDNTAFSVNAQPLAATSGGATPCYITSAASTNATNCKASAGQIYGLELINTTSTLYYLRLYNLASAPTCSSATGFVRTLPVPHGTGAGGGLTTDHSVGEVYGTGIGFCLTGGGSSTDNTNAATGVYVTVLYK